MRFFRLAFLWSFIGIFILNPVLPVLAETLPDTASSTVPQVLSTSPSTTPPQPTPPVTVAPPVPSTTSTVPVTPTVPETLPTSTSVLPLEAATSTPVSKSITSPKNILDTLGNTIKDLVAPVKDLFSNQPSMKEIAVVPGTHLDDSLFQVQDDVTDVAYVGKGKAVYRVFQEPRILYHSGENLKVRPAGWNWFSEKQESKLVAPKTAGYQYDIPVSETELIRVKSGYFEEAKKKISPQVPKFSQEEKDFTDTTLLKNVYPNIDVRFTDTKSLRTREIILNKRPENVRKSDVLTFWEEYELPPQSQVFTSQGKKIENILKGKNQPVIIQTPNKGVLTIAPPAVYDGKGLDPVEREVNSLAQPLNQIVEFDANKNSLRIGVQLDAAYILNESRVFPVVIDPVYHVCNEGFVGDTLNCTRSEFYLKYKIGNSLVDAGSDPLNLYSGYGYDSNGVIATRHAILKFAGLNIPANQRIDSANLYLYKNSNVSFGTFNNPVNLTVKRINVAWNNAGALTYNFLRSPAANLTAGPTDVAITCITGNCPAGWKSWDVTGFVQGWYSNPNSNQGVVVEPRPPWTVGDQPDDANVNVFNSATEWPRRILVFDAAAKAGNNGPYLEISTSNVGQPDLTSANLNRVSSNSVAPGQQLTFWHTIRNVGNGDSAAIPNPKVYYYFHQDTASYDNQFKIRELIFGAVPAGQNFPEVSIAYTIPANTPPGLYKLSYWIDAEGVVGESSENNNKFTQDITVTAPAQPDLTYTNSSIDANSVVPGSSVRLDLTVRNSGTAATPQGGTVYYYFHAGNASYALADKVGEDSYGILNSGSTSAESFTYIVPPNTPSGQYYLSLWIDGESGGIIPESNENNNKQSFLVTVSQGQDLGAGNVTYSNPSQKMSGQTVDIQALLSNIGNIATNNVPYKLKIEDINTGIQYDLTNISPVINLAAGEQSSFILRGTIPANIPFSSIYQAIVQMDPNNSIAEINENNNSSYSNNSIQIDRNGYCGGCGGGANPPASNQLPDTDRDSFSDVEEKFAGTNIFGAQAVSLYDLAARNKLATTVDKKAKAYGADPVNIRTGGFEFTQTDYSLKGRGVPIDITRTYNSLVVDKNNRLGNGWNLSYNIYYYQDPTTKNVLVYLGGTLAALFTTPDNGNTFVAPAGVDDTLAIENGKLVYRTLEGTKYIFGKLLTTTLGMVDQIVDRNGNATTFSYTTVRDVPLLTRIIDPSRRTVDLVYGANDSAQWDKVVQIRETFNPQDIRQINYNYDGSGNLIQVVDARTFDGITEMVIKQFTYDAASRMTSYTDARGTILYNTYDDQGRVIAQREFNPRVDAVGESRLVYELQYIDGNYAPAPTSVACTVVKNYRAVNSFYSERTCFDNKGLTVLKENGLGQITQSTYNADGMPALVTDAKGNRYQYQYDNRRRLTREILPDTAGFHTEHGYTYENGFNQMTEKTETMTNRQNQNLPAVTRRTQYTIDAQNGNVREIIDPLLNRETFLYDQFGNITRHTDKVGGVIDYGYDPNGNYLLSETQSVTQADGSVQNIVKQYTYDARGNQTQATTPRGNRFTFAYDNHNNVRRVTDPAGSTQTFEYDLENHKTRQTNELGQVTNFVYDTDIRASLLEVEQVGANGSLRVRHTYDFVGNLMSDIDARGNATTYSYDAANRLVTRQAPLNTIQYTYDLNGNKIREVNSIGGKTEYAYDELNQMTSVKGFTDANNFVENRVVYDGFGRKIQSTDANGNNTRFDYDLMDRVTSSVDAGNNTTRFVYDAMGQKIGEVMPRAVVDATLRNQNGHSTSFAYDTKGRVIKTTNAVGKQTWNFYDQDGNLVRTIDRMNADGTENTHSTQFEYDALGRQTRSVDALGGAMVKTYDAVGNVLTQTDQMNRTTRFTYDDFNRLVTQTDPAANVTRMVYDENGNQTSLTYADGTTMTSVYDAANRLTRITDANNASRSFSYDAVGNKLTETDKRGFITRYSYDLLNRLTTETNPQGTITTYTYDGNGNKLSESTLNKVKRFTVDGLNRVTGITYPGGKTEAFAYDANGNQTQNTDGKNQVIQFTYDALNRPIKKDVAVNVFVTYAYDNWNNLTRTVEPKLTTVFVYDVLNRQTQERKTFSDIANQTFTINKTYSADGQLASVEDAAARQVTYTYDNRGLLQNVMYQNQALVNYAYNAMQKPTVARYLNGVVMNSTYDTLNRTSRLNIVNAQNQTLLSQDYIYDTESNRTRMVETSGVNGRNSNRTVDYSYDEIEQLTRVNYSDIAGNNDMLFTYDSWGNRVSLNTPTENFNFTYANDSQEVASYTINGYLSVAHTYDGNGSLSREVLTRLGRPLKTVDYTWDTQNRLSQIRSINTSAPNFFPAQNENTIAFEYDDNGNRIKKTVNQSDVSYTLNTGVTVLNELNGAGQVEKTVVQGLGQVAEIKKDGSLVFTHTDVLGSPILLTDAQAQVVGEYDYDPFGNLVGTDGTEATKYLFTGQEYDSESDLYYYNARYYNPVIGRFISRDASQGKMGDMLSRNGYVYVKNNPLKYLDPTGNEEENSLSIASIDWNKINRGLDKTQKGINFVGDILTFGTFSSGFDRAGEAGSRVAREGASVKTIGKAVYDVGVGTFETGLGALGTGVALGEVRLLAAPYLLGRNIENDVKWVSPSTPVGSRNMPLQVPNGTNSPTVIGGQEFSGHAIDKLQKFGIPPSVVNNVVNNGVAIPGKTIGTTMYYDKINDITVILNTKTNNIITVSPGYIKQ